MTGSTIKKYYLLILLAASGTAVFSNTPLKDPLIPEGEEIRYRVSGDDGTISLVQRVDTVVQDDGSSWYRITTNSPLQDGEIDIARDSLVPYRSYSVTKSGRTDFISSSEIRSVPPLANDEIFLVDFSSLSHVLRGYPFDSHETLHLVFPNTPDDSDRKNPVSFRIRYVKKESISLGEETFTAHKLQLNVKMSGGMAMFSGMVPKTYFWYSEDQPHYLLKYEGSSGSGGNDKIVMEFESYRTGR